MLNIVYDQNDNLATNKCLNYIQEHIDNRSLLLFPLERFDDSLVILNKLFPDYFKDISYKKENISKKDQLVSKENRDSISKLICKSNWGVFNMANVCLDEYFDYCK